MLQSLVSPTTGLTFSLARFAANIVMAAVPHFILFIFLSYYDIIFTHHI